MYTKTGVDSLSRLPFRERTGKHTCQHTVTDVTNHPTHTLAIELVIAGVVIIRCPIDIIIIYYAYVLITTYVQ